MDSMWQGGPYHRAASILEHPDMLAGQTRWRRLAGVVPDRGSRTSSRTPSQGMPKQQPLRANMDETDLLVVITEQGENRNPCEEQRNIFGFSSFSPGFARRCAT